MRVRPCSLGVAQATCLGRAATCRAEWEDGLIFSDSFQSKPRFHSAGPVARQHGQVARATFIKPSNEQSEANAVSISPAGRGCGDARVAHASCVGKQGSTESHPAGLEWSFPAQSEPAIDFGAVLDAVDANEFFRGIHPVEDAVIAHAEFAQARQILGHSHEPPVNHAGGILSEPLNLAFDADAHRGIQSGELRIRFAAYFDLVGHGRWRGFQGLN